MRDDHETMARYAEMTKDYMEVMICLQLIKLKDRKYLTFLIS